MAMGMADWSQLPPELLILIAKRLKTRIDVVRFRSVCSSWRSSSCPPKLYPLPRCLPSKTQRRFDYSLTHITRNTYFLLRRLPPPPEPDHETGNNRRCWLVKIRDGTDRVKMRLLDPLSDSELKPLPPKAKVLDLTNFQVIELAHEFLGRYNVYMDHSLEPQSYDYCDKVALIWSNTNSNDFTMLALFRGHLAFLRSAEKNWHLLEEVPHNGIHDITSFHGKFYTIDQQGRTIAVDQSLNPAFLYLQREVVLGSPIPIPNSRKFLVPSVDNLLAVEMLLFQVTSGSANGGGFVRDYEVAGFRIFRLDEEGMKWDEMGSLGDQILILGLRQAISVSCSELPWSRGNLIFYSTGLCIPPRDGHSQDGVTFVFDLETGKATPLEDCPAAYCNLFGPPPEWVEFKSCDSVVSSPESVMSHSADSISSADTDSKCPERVTSVGEKPNSKRPSTSSKSSFKFCCF